MVIHYPFWIVFDHSPTQSHAPNPCGDFRTAELFTSIENLASFFSRNMGCHWHVVGIDNREQLLVAASDLKWHKIDHVAVDPQPGSHSANKLHLTELLKCATMPVPAADS